MLKCIYVLVGGGGGGRFDGSYGGGGGAGGYILNWKDNLCPTAKYPVVVGAGGALDSKGVTSKWISEL